MFSYALSYTVYIYISIDINDMVRCLLSVVLVVAFLSLGRADLPVHCTRDHIIGDWTVFVYQGNHDRNNAQSLTFCGHESPDRVESSAYQKDHAYWKDHFDKSGDYADPVEYKLHIETGSATFHRKSQPVSGETRFTMIYDEAFQITDSDDNKYIGIFNFKPVDGWDAQVSESDLKEWESLCDRTSPSPWFAEHDPHGKWGCFLAIRNEHLDPTNSDNAVLEQSQGSTSDLMVEPADDGRVSVERPQKASWFAPPQQGSFTFKG